MPRQITVFRDQNFHRYDVEPSIWRENEVTKILDCIPTKFLMVKNLQDLNLRDFLDVFSASVTIHNVYTFLRL